MTPRDCTGQDGPGGIFPGVLDGNLAVLTLFYETVVWRGIRAKLTKKGGGPLQPAEYSIIEDKAVFYLERRNS